MCPPTVKVRDGHHAAPGSWHQWRFGGLGVARALDAAFVQEVIGGTTAVQRHQPEADVVIELGGEDAKITYPEPIPEQRVNGSCAGGTGAFIDQMTTPLRTDAAGLDRLAECHLHLYPITSRCGVFAESVEIGGTG